MKSLSGYYFSKLRFWQEYESTQTRVLRTMALERFYPGLQTPASLLFSYPSRIADVFCPFSEKVVREALWIPEMTVQIEVKDGDTSLLRLGHWTRNPWRRRKRRLPPLKDAEGFIYDARWQSLENVTHVLAFIATDVLLAREMLLENEYPPSEMTVVVFPGTPEYTKTMLRLLSFNVVETDHELSGKIIQVKRKSSSKDPQQHFPLPDLFSGSFPGYKRDTPQRIFIARRISRTLCNESEVEQALGREGFVKVYFEDLSVPEQWSIMRNASEIVGIHGAALGQLLFHLGHRTGVGPKVVEIFNAGYVVRCFEHYVSAQKGKWAAVRSMITPQMIRDMDLRQHIIKYKFTSCRVDPDTILQALEYVRQR